jgi:hypothetical protein
MDKMEVVADDIVELIESALIIAILEEQSVHLHDLLVKVRRFRNLRIHHGR